ncbi:MAG TPA: class I SAM-dependent methyltransferase [Bacteroidales bacterium]|nr:class I SAM-dependent methyltransferase [Bacteroidales bacterium]
MNEFERITLRWDTNPGHLERSKAVSEAIIDRLELDREMTALEYGAGTGITSFLLKDHFKEIVMIDNSRDMVRIMKSKIKELKVSNLRALHYDLEKGNWEHPRFNLIFTQMVLHHIRNIDNLIGKLSDIIYPGGFLAIADLYKEDGSFHKTGFNGHNGFDPEKLGQTIKNYGFTDILSRKCHTINKLVSEKEMKSFDLFLLTARKQ